MKISTLFFLLLSTLLTSCVGYKTQLSCHPAKGVPCTPVTEIESMIIESCEGTNIFLGSESDQKADSNKCEMSLQPSAFRVWITPKRDGRGKCLKGFYLYLNPECISRC